MKHNPCQVLTAKDELEAAAMDEMLAFDAPVTEMDCEEVEEDPFGFGMELG